MPGVMLSASRGYLCQNTENISDIKAPWQPRPGCMEPHAVMIRQLGHQTAIFPLQYYNDE